MKISPIAWVICAALWIWLSVFSSAVAKPDSALLREWYEQPQRKQTFEKYFSDPNALREERKRLLGAIGILPEDERAASMMVEEVVRMDGLLCDYVYRNKEIGDIGFLEGIYSNANEPRYMRAFAAFLLYLRTDRIEYAVNYCRMSEAKLGFLAEVRDSNLEAVLAQVIAGAWVEAAPRAGAKDYSRDFPNCRGLAASYGRVCASIFVMGLDKQYAVFMFERMDYLKRFSNLPVHAGEVALQMVKASQLGCRMFIVSRIEAGDIKGIEQIRAASPELDALVREVCAEQIAKYEAIRDLPPVPEPNAPVVSEPAKPVKVEAAKPTDKN